jgi:hypothetical protein
MSAPTLPDKATFTLAEVAEVSGFTLRSIEDACRAGRISHRHFGRQRVLTREQLATFLAATEVEAKPKAKAPMTQLLELERTRERVADRIARRRGRAA